MKDLFITVMFPYPSGSGLHCGHWYNYSIVDSFCKIQKYKGFKVYQPFGFDSFGLPAENYAKKVGRNPKEVTYENIENFRKEMVRMDTSFEEKLITSESNYIEKTQWLFNELFKRGLAYKKMGIVNWDPIEKTVLANEQIIDGKGERSGAIIEQKEMEQWYFKITDYRERLIKDLEKVDYPEKTKKQQLYWLREDNFRDWCVSRQRSWGCPIPVEGETDTLDTFVDSSFYTIIYDKTRPVDIYVGGNEHACAHLIYARFITKFLFDIGYIDFDEPFKKVIHQGMILGEDGNKMSKRLNNVVDLNQYEPQLLRMYLMFINHYFEGGKWQDAGYKGCERFKNRLFTWFDKSIEEGETIDLNEFKRIIIGYFDSWKVNKVVSTWMEFYNKNKGKVISKKTKEELEEFFNICF